MTLAFSLVDCIGLFDHAVILLARNTQRSSGEVSEFNHLKLANDLVELLREVHAIYARCLDRLR